MARIHVHGEGMTVYVTPIGADVAEELTSAGVSRERFDELRSNESTYAAGIHSDLELYVDGGKVSTPVDDEAERSGDGRFALPAGRHHLVVKETARGRWLDLETAEPFDPDKFSAVVNTYVLATGESITITAVDYDGDSSLGETEIVDEEAIVVFPDGAMKEVLFPGEATSETAEVFIMAGQGAPAGRGAKTARAKKAPARKKPAETKADKERPQKSGARKPTAKKAAAKKATAKKAKAKKAPVKQSAGKTSAARRRASTPARARAKAAKRGAKDKRPRPK